MTVVNLAHLALLNAFRNLNRSLLTVSVMAIAAFMLVASLSTERGRTEAFAESYRSYVEADILVYPDWALPDDETLLSVDKRALDRVVLPETFGSPLAYFHPNYYEKGYLSDEPAPDYSLFPSREEMARVIETVLTHPEVVGAEAFRTVPIIGGSLSVADGRGSENPVELRGFLVRPYPGEPGGPGPQAVRLREGRDFGGLAGWVGMVNLRAVVDHWTLKASEEGPAVDMVAGPGGQVVTLLLPRIVPSPSTRGGAPRYDFMNPVSVNLTIVAGYEVPTRVHTWTIVEGKERVPGQEQLYLEAPEILVPRETFDDLLALMGLGPDDPPPAGALAVRLRSQVFVERTASELRELLPGYAVVSVATDSACANRRGWPEQSYESPPEARPDRFALGQPVIPAGTGSVLHYLLFGFAGVLAAGSSTLTVLIRRSEVGILKAIGLRDFEVGGVVLGEVLAASSLGLCIGYVAGEALILPGLLASGVGWSVAGPILGRDFLLTVLMSFGTAVVAAVFPLAVALRVTVMEVLRNE